MDNRKVVIIGAGAAGLSVAQQLAQHGDCEIVHLEAQAEVGGRVKGITFAGLELDSGASFLHHKRLGLYAAAKQRKWLAKAGKVGAIVNGRYLPSWRFALFCLLPSMQKSKRFIRAFYSNTDSQKTLAELIDEQGFNPALPSAHQQAIDSLGMGHGGSSSCTFHGDSGKKVCSR